MWEQAVSSENMHLFLMLHSEIEGSYSIQSLLLCMLPNSKDPFLFQKKATRQLREGKSKVSSKSVGLDTATSQFAENPHHADEFHLSPSTQSWAKEGTGQYGGFPGFSSTDGMIRELDDGQFDQEDGVTQVTCM